MSEGELKAPRLMTGKAAETPNHPDHTCANSDMKHRLCLISVTVILL